MSGKPSKWRCEPYDVAAALRLADGLGVSPVLGTVLARRGFESVEQARAFLEGRERHDPLTLPGVADACEAVRRHLERGSRIVVFGDYDVDGVCSTAILLRALRALGADPAWELPSRFGEGYGLSRAAVERLAAAGAGLLITVDCGITAVDEVAAARRAGLDVVVSDHHRPGPQLPGCTVVHPGLGDFGAPDLVRLRGRAQAGRGAGAAGRRGGPRPGRPGHGLRHGAAARRGTGASCARAFGRCHGPASRGCGP